MSEMKQNSDDKSEDQPGNPTENKVENQTEDQAESQTREDRAKEDQTEEDKANNEAENYGYKISEHDKLVVDIRNNLSTRLADLMSKLLNTAQDALFDLSNEADNNEDQTRYFELMNQIRNLKPTIAADFGKNIKQYLVPAKDYDAQRVKKEVADEDELSLVDQDEMEGIVLVKGIGERAAARYREQLSHLEARLEHLSTKTKTVFKQDALKPTNFCQAFDDAMADNFSNENKKLLFSMFDIEIANKLDALYDSINNRLIDANILPQIKLHMSKKQASRPRPPQNQGADADATAQQEDYSDDGGNAQYGGSAGYAGGGTSGAATGSAAGGGSAGAPGGGQQGSASGGTGGAAPAGSSIGGFAMTAAPGTGYRHGNQSSLQAQSGKVGGGEGQPASGASGGTASGGASPDGSGAGGQNTNTAQGGGGQAGGQIGGQTGNQAGNQAGNQSSISGDRAYGEPGTGAQGGEFQHYTAGMPASQVGRVLGNYLGGNAITPATTDTRSEAHADFFPASTPQHFGHQEIIQALTSLQSLPQFEQPEEVRFDGEAIKQAVLEEIAKTSGGAVTKRINQIAEKTIDFIELIFDAIIDDEDISDTIKALLLRLQIPIIKASMADQEFFIYDDHPARVLLDTIADVGIGVTEHTDTVYKFLDKTVSGILGEYEISTETFQQALDKLNGFIEEQEAAARAIEEEEQRQLLRKHARATVLKALRATTTGKILPEAVHPLILKRWPTLMFNHYLNYGKENDEWVNMVVTLRHIVDSVQSIHSAEALAKLMAEKDELFEKTEEYLNISSKSKKDIRNILDSYRETIQDIIDDANYSKEEVSIAEEVISHAEPVDEPPIEEEAEKPAIPANVMPGMWFRIYMGEDHPPRRCKLSVIIVEDSNLMFVDHKGSLIAEKSFDEFNKEVAENKTSEIMGHSVFDHAFKAVINRLN